MGIGASGYRDRWTIWRMDKEDEIREETLHAEKKQLEEYREVERDVAGMFNGPEKEVQEVNEEFVAKLREALEKPDEPEK